MSSVSETLHGPSVRDRLRSMRRLLLVLVPLVAVASGVAWYLASAHYVSTDDAYVQADMVSISSDVGGRVVNLQAAMIGYIDDYKFMMFICLAALPLLFLLRPHKTDAAAAPATE